MLSVKNAITKWLRDNLMFELSLSQVTSSDMLFRDYFLGYLKSLDGGIRSRSFSSVVNTATHIIAGLGDYKMSELNKRILKEFINGFAKQTYIHGKNAAPKYYSQSQIDKVYDLLHAAIKEAADEDGERLIRTDFMANIKKPRSNQLRPPEPRALRDEEIMMISRIVRENRMICLWIHLLLYTGVRPSEPLALKFTDVDYNKGTIRIERTLSKEEFPDVDTLKAKSKTCVPIITTLKNEQGGKVNLQRRTLKVGNIILRMLKLWEIYVTTNPELMKMKREHGTEEYIFCGPSGQLWIYDYYQQIYERLLKKHGLSISDYYPYRFRHNCCTRLFRLGVDIKTVQLIMGDNTPDMVMRVYANLEKSDVLRGSQHYSDSLSSVLLDNMYSGNPDEALGIVV